MMKRRVCLVLSILLILSAAAFLTACGDKSGGETNDDSLKEIQDKGQLILGCDDEFPPMGFIGDNGEIVGFDIDLARATAEKLGVELVVKPIDWDAKEMELSSGNIDVIWNGYSMTAERLDKVQYTKPYLNNAQYIAVKADSEVNTKADLAGKIVGLQLESSAEDAMEANPDFRDSLAEVREYDTYQQALNDLNASSRIDAVVVDKILIEYIMQQSPGSFRILDETLGDEYFGIGCRKGSFALADAIDKALDDMQKDGTTDSICEKWFSSNVVVRDVDRLTAKDFE